MANPKTEYSSLVDLLSPQDPRKALYLAMAKQGMDTSPIGHWSQGLARMANSFIGNYGIAADEADKREQAKHQIAAALANPRLGGSGVVPPAPESPTFFSRLATLLGGGQQGAPPPLSDGPVPPLAGQPVPPPAPVQQAALPNVPAAPLARPEVMPSARVWGDKEAEAAGLYERPGARPSPAPPAPLGPMPMPSGTASDDPARAAAYEIGKRQIVAALGNQNPVAAVGAVPPSTAAMAAPPPPVPPSLPPGAAPTLPGAVVPRSEPTVPANMVPYIRGLMNLNTFTRGQTELDRYSKPNEYDYKPLEDGSFLAFNKNNPNDRHHIPGNSQALIDFHAQKQGRAAAAEQAVKLSPEAIRARAEEAGLTERAQGEAKKAVAKPDLDKIRQEAGKVVVDDIDRVLKLSRGQTWNDPVTGLTGQLASNVPGTKAHNAAKLIDTIKANSAFDALQQMRQASPTGAALGAVTDKEIYKLEVARGNLEQSQETEQFEDNLKRYKNIFMDIIHGEGKGPAREKLDYKSRGIKGTTTSGVKWSVE